MKHRWPLVGIGLAAALALPALAGAQTYPEPKDPGKVAPKPKGPFHTYTVCKRGCDFRKIQAAVDKAKAGDKVKIKSGTYREAVTVNGAQEGLPAHRRQPEEPAQGRPRRAQEGPERHLRQRRRRGDDRRRDGPQLQGQRVLRRQRRRLHDEPPRRREDRHLRPLRLQLQGRHDGELRGLLRQRRRVLHRADAAAAQADPLDRAQRRRLGRPDRLQRHATCAT